MTAPKLSWSDLAGARVGVWGLGREGHANLRKLLALGVEPVLVDDRPRPAPVDGRPVLATGDGGLAALQRCDVVVKTPGLSRYRPEVARLSAAGIPVVGGLGLWLAEADLRRVLCVTGTKGKSTTSSLTGHLLTGLGYRCMVGGNIGAVPYDPANAGDFDYWVIEVSSYQATDLPCLAARGRGHLAAPGPSRLARGSRAVLPGQAVRVLPARRRAHRGERRQRPAPGARRAARPAGRVGQRARRPRRRDWMEPLGLPGRHNRRNALIARRCLVALGVPGAADAAALRAAAARYRPLPELAHPGRHGLRRHLRRRQPVHERAAHAGRAGRVPGSRRIALIVGCDDRGIDYAPLAAGVLARDAPTFVLTLPDSGPRIRAQIEAA